MHFTKDIFRKIYGLQKKQPWVSTKVDALEQLIFSDCAKDEQRELVIDLINRFEYLPDSKFIDIMHELAEDLATDPHINENETMLVAMTAGSGSDSGQFVLYGLKSILEKYGWRDYKQVNNYANVHRNYKKNPIYKHIILVDEFIGSGQTAQNRVNDIKKLLTKSGYTKFDVSVRVLVASQVGLSKLSKAGISVKSCISLERGITEYYTSSLVMDMITLMKEIEFLLQDSYRGRDLPSLGYGAVEALYCRENGNTPNRVYPIFWKPFYKDVLPRFTILTSDMVAA